MKRIGVRVLRAAIVAVGIGTLASGCGSGNSSNSPTAPGSTVLSATWTGTLTRPGGLAPMTVRWVATQSDTGLSGPLTLTNNGVSVTFPAQGGPAGNDSSGFRFFMQFKGDTGSISGFPTCAVLGNTQGTPDAFPSPYNKVTVASFSISYQNCKGFIDTGASTGLSEVAQLTMSK